MSYISGVKRDREDGWMEGWRVQWTDERERERKENCCSRIALQTTNNVNSLSALLFPNNRSDSKAGLFFSLALVMDPLFTFSPASVCVCATWTRFSYFTLALNKTYRVYKRCWVYLGLLDNVIYVAITEIRFAGSSMMIKIEKNVRTLLHF